MTFCIALTKTCGAGIANVQFASNTASANARVDEYSLEDVLTHILSNADRHRSKDSVIAITLDANAAGSKVRVRNVGEAIPDQLFDKIFEYGVSDHKAENTSATRDQGLFVVKTYMAKMGDTVTAKNEVDGVSFELQFPPVV